MNKLYFKTNICNFTKNKNNYVNKHYLQVRRKLKLLERELMKLPV